MEEFISTVQALPAYSPETATAYENFIRAYGTHLLNYIEYGAKYIINTVGSYCPRDHTCRCLVP